MENEINIEVRTLEDGYVGDGGFDFVKKFLFYFHPFEGSVLLNHVL